jgi:hypothetical protein
MRLLMTFPNRRRCRWAFSGSRMMSMGARCEQVLASRLVALERLLDKADDDAAPALWAEYYVVVDLWLRSRAPVTTGPLFCTAANGRRTVSAADC